MLIINLISKHCRKLTKSKTSKSYICTSTVKLLVRVLQMFLTVLISCTIICDPGLMHVFQCLQMCFCNFFYNGNFLRGSLASYNNIFFLFSGVVDIFKYPGPYEAASSSRAPTRVTFVMATIIYSSSPPLFLTPRFWEPRDKPQPGFFLEAREKTLNSLDDYYFITIIAFKQKAIKN